MLPIALSAQLVHVVPDVARVELQADGTLLIVAGFVRFEECLERHLGIDHHLLAAR